MTHLHRMSPGQSGKVVGLTDDSPVARRLTELGIIPGSRITYLRNAPLRDPLEIQVGNCCLTLRHAEASLIAVELDS
jgi:ferrous iron transport protein A